MYTWPFFSQDELDAVSNVLKSGKVNYWTGDQCKLFEKEFAKFMGVEFGLSLANGTLALELALRSCGIGVGDEVITSPRTFIASTSCIVAVGAIPVFADIALNSGNITAETISKKITSKTKAILPVHLAGYPCKMDDIIHLSRENSLYVIEDCAQAHGASYKNKYVGTWGHWGAFSFCQDKIMTTGGEGGMLISNNKKLYEKAWSYKDHGKNFHESFNQKSTTFRWLHESFGTNMRMTEMQAAIGRKQLKKLPTWIKRRNKIANMYTTSFKKFSFVETPYIAGSASHAFYKYYFSINTDILPAKWNKDRIIKEITSKGVECFSGGCSEIYLEKAIKNSPYKLEKKLPNAYKLGKCSLMILCHPTLSEQRIKKTIEIFSLIFEDIERKIKIEKSNASNRIVTITAN